MIKTKELIELLEYIRGCIDERIEDIFWVDEDLIDEIIKRLTEHDLQKLRKFDVVK